VFERLFTPWRGAAVGHRMQPQGPGTGCGLSFWSRERNIGSNQIKMILYTVDA
jgi:hypothetical protein